ncbi:Long-chain-fatty-acid--CoA ligase 6, partial [Globomyces sp. JEL0801]
MKSHEFLGIPVFSLDELKSMKEQAVPVSEPENENETAIYRSALSKEKLIYSMDHSQSIQELFARAVKAFPNKRCFGTRYPSLVDGEKVWGEYVWKSYEEADEDRQHFGFGLMQLYDQHVTNKVDKWFMGIMSVNRYEWIIADLGAGSFSIGNAALYDTLGPDACEYILNHAEIPIAVVSIDKVPTIFKLVPKCPHLKVIIVLESLLKGEKPDAESYKEQGTALGVTIVSFNETLQLGESNPRPFQLPSSDDIATLSYTSGTTGTPKAAMMSHGNFIAASISAQSLEIDENDIHMSYLPLAHIFEKSSALNVYVRGGCIGFFRGTPKLLMEDLLVLQPNTFVAVPRVLNKIYDKMTLATIYSDSFIKSNLVSHALKSKLHHLKKDGSLTHAIWDPLVFNKMKQVFGGQLRGILSAGAPIDTEVMNFFRVVLGASMIESYGQTETTGIATLVWPTDFDGGHVGSPALGVEMKLVSVPDMEYFAKDLK